MSFLWQIISCFSTKKKHNFFFSRIFGDHLFFSIKSQPPRVSNGQPLNHWSSYKYCLIVNHKIVSALQLQMAVRQGGCVGVYVLMAFIHTKKENRSEQLRRVGEIIMGIYLFAYAYILNSSSEYKRGFLHHFLDSDWLRYFITLAIVACALCFLSSYFVRDMSVCAALMLITVTIVMDLDFDYWTRRGVHFWNQARMLLDSLTAVTGFALFSRVFENRIKTEHYK